MSDPIHPDRRDFLRLALAASASASLPPGALAETPAEAEARVFLKGYNEGWLPLETLANEAAWVASTDVSEAHTAAQVARNQALSEFVGSTRVIETTRRLLDRKSSLDDLTARQLEKVRLRAAEAPGDVPEVVKARIKAEADQSAAQDGFAYTLNRQGKPEEHPTANAIDRVLVESPDLDERRDYWETVQDHRRPAPRRAFSSSATSATRSPRPSASTRSSRSRSPTTG